MSRRRSLGSSQCAAPETPSPVDVAAEAVTKSPSGEDDEMEESAQVAFHKRRRISRACDDCRRRKIKCDGKRPCSSCAEFNSECTYQVPSKRSKAPSHHPQRDARDLEAKLEFAESIIRRFLPHIDLNDIGSTAHQLAQPHDARDDVSRSDHGSAAESSMQGDTYIPLVQNEDQLRYTDSGELDFHGTSSSAAFLSHITQNFPELLRYDPRIPFLPHATRPDVPYPVPATFRGYPNYDYSRLPPRELARMLCEYSFNHASCLLKIVHVPSFYERFDALYDAQKTEYTLDEGRYVGLLYSILALGSMYDVDENNPSNPDHYNEATTRGYKFYVGARWFVPDLTECPDMTCLQALLFIIQFLQAIGNLKSCYSLIGVALRTALRMGLHRNLYNIHMNPIENETRKRVFHTIRQMDIYLSTTLGLPIVLQARDIDQPLPTDIDDEYIAQDTMLAVPPGKLPIMQAFNAHVKLMEILAIVIEHVYPPRATSRSDSHATYLIDCRQLKQVEKRLHDWHHDLPAIWRPGQDNDVHLKRVQILLRFAYAHVQMMLYRPFLQYFNHQKPLGKPQDHRHRAFATTGITVCRNIISIGREIRNEAALLGPYWFILYTQFLAVLCLVSYVSHNPEAPEASDILADAVLGKGLISGLSLRSLAADRLSAALDAVFEQLPNRLGSTVLTPNYAPGRSSTAPGIAVDVLNSSRSFSSPNDWLVSKPPAPRPVGIPEYPAVNYGESPTSQIPSGIMHALSDADADRVMFSFNDPIAYPSTTAWSPSQGPSSSLTDDTVHLVIPDLFSDINGRHNQPTTTAQSGDSNPASYPTSTLLSIDRGTLLNDYLSNIF